MSAGSTEVPSAVWGADAVRAAREAAVRPQTGIHAVRRQAAVWGVTDIRGVVRIVPCCDMLNAYHNTPWNHGTLPCPALEAHPLSLPTNCISWVCTM